MTSPISFFVDDLVEGGGPPIQQNLRIQSALFVDFNYGGRSPMVTALKLDLITDAASVVTQHYSCGDPATHWSYPGWATPNRPTDQDLELRCPYDGPNQRWIPGGIPEGRRHHRDSMVFTPIGTVRPSTVRD